MKMTDFFKPAYFKAADLVEPVIVTIADCRVETVGMQNDELPVLYFTETPTKLVVKKAISDGLCAVFGSQESDDWIGKQIELFNDKTVQFNGRSGGVRVRAPQSARAGSRTSDEADQGYGGSRLSDSDIPF